jgi:type II secretory pathway component GspD/PulD (secretin)
LLPFKKMNRMNPERTTALWRTALVIGAGLLTVVQGWTVATAHAQQEESKPNVQVMEIQSSDGTVQRVERVVQPGQATPPPGATPPSSRPSGPPGGLPPGMKPPGAKDEKKPGEDGKEEAKKVEPIQRPDKPSQPADPEELKVRPNEAGMVSFQFRGQSWPDVIDWLGEISNQSVDWQELPGDYVNLSTQREYSVAECRDLLNRLLLARGYTLLDHDGFLMVVKCEGISAGLVPRVAREELTKRQPHEFVRVMLPLDWMLAEEAAKELEPLLSKNGKLFPLKTTNRLEAMDAVANLSQIDSLLREEQSDNLEEPRLVREFVLVHARADEVREQLQQFLGLSSDTTSMRAMTPQQMAQQQRMMQMQMQQMQQQQRQSGKTPTPPTKSKEDPVRLMINARRNSLLVQAPPDKMAVIENAIRLIDVPGNEPQSLQGLLGRMRTYRLSQLDPEKLATTLQELGCLEPTTRLEVDEDNRAIIAYASPADHFTIQSTVEKLDGSARSVEVIPLKRMPADEVAGTIEYLMNGAEKENSSRRSYDYYSPFGYRSRSSRQESNDSFRVDADIVNNRLLVRANDVELEEVLNILAKLGEVTQPGGSGSLTRVLDITPGEDTDQFLKELEQGWKLLGPNPLVVPKSSNPNTADAPSTTESSPATEDAPAAPAEENEPSASRQPLQSRMFRTALYPSTQRDGPANDFVQSDDEPPIMVTIGGDGRVVLASQDPQALDLLEELAARIAPRQKDYKVFKLEHAPAGWVVFNLQDFFEDEDAADDRRNNRMMSYIFGFSSSGSRDEPRRLSQRRPLKFISDIDTNTILVQGADEQQLQTIAELIELYDVPEPAESQSTRVTKLFPIKYSQASVVAETVKDAYRDLLSDNDKALQQGRSGNQNQQRPYSGMTIMNMGFGDENTQSPRTSVRFKGKLSIGVDDVTNTLVVSTEGEALMAVVEGMITALDERAKPVSEVRVLTLQSNTDGSRIQQALSKVLSQQGQATRAPSQAAGRPQRPGAAGQPRGGNPAPNRQQVIVSGG